VFVDTILVLDDDPANLQGITGILQSEHYAVIATSNGLQAIESGRKSPSMSLFLTDMNLPNSSGTEVALKLLALYPNLPVLFISGSPMDWWTSRDVFNFKRFPQNRVDFIEKPFYVSQLLMKVCSLIGQRAQLRIGDNTQENQAA
jgi:two-component system cell cycle sensor histidine kinase/response regulator CckA